MRTYKTEEVPATIREILDTVSCDLCGKDMEYGLLQGVRGGTLSFDAGYGSRFDFIVSDISEYERKFDICDDCIEKLLIQLKVIVQ